MRWLITVILLTFAPSAWACDCKEFAAGDAADKADAIFYGKFDGENFQVLKRFKGRLKKKFSLDEPRDDCDFGAFQADKSYLVFVDRHKKASYASVCMGTRELAYEPISPVMMTLADQPQYGITKRDRDRHQRTRDKMVDQATELLQRAAERCDPGVWKSKEASSGHLEVRFDNSEGRLFTAEILRYTTSGQTNEETTQCLKEQLKERKFPKFDGGPFSIHAYYLVDRIDVSMVRKKKSGSVVPLKSNEGPKDGAVID